MDIASAKQQIKNTVQIYLQRTLWAATDFRWCTSGPSSCWVRQVWARLPLCSRSLMRWGLAL